MYVKPASNSLCTTECRSKTNH
uniref:Uncharacterized protein n=1 Tax=Anguilla anguilla TaxID=7936 RepID=A0A0E9T5B2_ANGAN